MTACLMLLLLSLLATGCSSYQLQGTVVQGPQSMVLVVSKDDPRLDIPGVSGASVAFTIDPRSLNANMLPPEMTDQQGRFVVDVPHLGAGMLEYELEVLCRAPGFVAAARNMKLPSASKRLLIVMSPGTDTYRQQNDILGETLEMGRQLSPGQ